MTVYELAPQFLGVAPVNLTTNLPDSDSEYYTWEMTATKRQSAGWSLLASFTHTWNREAAAGTGTDFTPNALINTTDGQDRFTTWQAKVNGAISLPWGFLVAPVVRHQSGTPYARTFVRTLNYGNATIKAEPVAANRTPNITLVDVRTEKTFRVGRSAGEGIRGHLQPFQRQRATDRDHQFRQRVAPADGDYRASHSPNRRAARMVAAGSTR